MQENKCLDRAIYRDPKVAAYYEAHPEYLELTEEEKAKPYAKFYYRPRPTPDTDTLAQLQPGHPMDPSLALLSDNINELLKPGYLEGETGYCLLPQGGGYCAVLTRFTDITYEQYLWWRGWWVQESLRYKLWYPGMHFATDHDPEWLMEDCGDGPKDIFLLRRNAPEDIGLDKEKMAAAKLLGVHSGTMIARNRLSGTYTKPITMTNAHVIREIDGGFEMRSRFWVGYQCLGNGLVSALSEGETIPEDMPYLMANHCVYEMAYLKSLIPELYAQEANK